MKKSVYHSQEGIWRAEAKLPFCAKFSRSDLILICPAVLVQKTGMSEKNKNRKPINHPPHFSGNDGVNQMLFYCTAGVEALRKVNNILFQFILVDILSKNGCSWSRTPVISTNVKCCSRVGNKTGQQERYEHYEQSHHQIFSQIVKWVAKDSNKR